MDLRARIQSIALRWPAYGYRRVHAELVRQGWEINHKRVLRLMRGDNLLCVRRRKFIFTTDSRHGLPIYPNLVEGLVVTSIDQLWVADISYIRLQLEFVDLAVLLDAFSWRCLGWALQRSLEAALALEALRMAPHDLKLLCSGNSLLKQFGASVVAFCDDEKGVGASIICELPKREIERVV
jgi:transposase InsO family protein